MDTGDKFLFPEDLGTPSRYKTLNDTYGSYDTFVNLFPVIFSSCICIKKRSAHLMIFLKSFNVMWILFLNTH